MYTRADFCGRSALPQPRRWRQSGWLPALDLRESSPPCGSDPPASLARLATGATADLIYVLPKSGAAVSRAAGDPWRDRLLRLPAFLRQGEGGANGWSDQDLQDGFRLTGLFLLRHVLEPRGQRHSDAREGFINAVAKPRTRMAEGLEE